MVPGVVPDDMAFGNHASQDSRVAAGELTNDEERGVRALALQQVEHMDRPWHRPVVHGERDALQLRAVRRARVLDRGCG
jgi:hypothetical protein